jgi:hypothetical protein
MTRQLKKSSKQHWDFMGATTCTFAIRLESAIMVSDAEPLSTHFLTLHYVVYDQLPPELTTWIESWTDGAKQPDRDFASLQISLGPNKSFFAFDKNSRRYHNLPTRFEVILQASPSDILPAGWAPSYVTLGPMGSYILRNTRGGRSSTLFPTTHGLKNFIQSPQKSGIVVST